MMGGRRCRLRRHLAPAPRPPVCECWLLAGRPAGARRQISCQLGCLHSDEGTYYDEGRKGRQRALHWRLCEQRPLLRPTPPSLLQRLHQLAGALAAAKAGWQAAGQERLNSRGRRIGNRFRR